MIKVLLAALVLALSACGPEDVDRFTAGSGQDAGYDGNVGGQEVTGGTPEAGPSTSAPVHDSNSFDRCDRAECAPERNLDRGWTVDPVEQAALREKHIHTNK